jgi:hypothetical protein
MYPITVVIGSWSLAQQPEGALRIEAPCIFFGTATSIEAATSIRTSMSVPTFYVELPLEDFLCKRYGQDPPQMMLNERIFLLRRAVTLNLFNSDWFVYATGTTPLPDTTAASTQAVLFLENGSYMIHASAVLFFVSLYDTYLRRCVKRMDPATVSDDVVWATAAADLDERIIRPLEERLALA